jgi:hypothetical protein
MVCNTWQPVNVAATDCRVMLAARGRLGRIRSYPHSSCSTSMSGTIGHLAYAILGAKAATHRKLPVAPQFRRRRIAKASFPTRAKIVPALVILISSPVQGKQLSRLGQSSTPRLPAVPHRVCERLPDRAERTERFSRRSSWACAFVRGLIEDEVTMAQRPEPDLLGSP